MTLSRNGPLLALLLLLRPAAASDTSLPPWLPRYDLEVDLDLDTDTVRTRQQVTWTNRHRQPTRQLVFNAHSHYRVPDDQVGFMAKTLEILRVPPGDALDSAGRALDVDRVTTGNAELPFRYEGDTGTDLVVDLPGPVGPGETVTVVLESTLPLPPKMGRWGRFAGVTFLSNWLPVLALYDDDGWHPAPFIPWHQPFANESGIYHARVRLPADQVPACTGTITAVRNLASGRKELHISAPGVRDFAFLCSHRYQEFAAEVVVDREAPPVKVRVVAFPEHEHYANAMVQTACDALAAYSRWFGPYPYPEFTIAEAFFGWNGNECSTLVMIDSRVFGMPHLAGPYIDYLVSHEICHQWWYNLVGTIGHCETWMDESLAVHFTHKLMNHKYGDKNNTLLQFPRGLEWLPNIRRQDYRSYGLQGTIGRGENGPILRPVDQFEHVVNLFSMCYDKGARVQGMIEERLGETAYLDFVRTVYRRYRYRVLRVADYQRELEEYTGRPWEEFFDHWLKGSGLCDWVVEKVHLHKTVAGRLLDRIRPRPEPAGPVRATILVRQKGEYCEPTVLGIALCDRDKYEIRLPIVPGGDRIELPEHEAVVQATGDGVLVDVLLPCKPKQITIDPDQVVVDREPGNNYWKKPVRFRLTPLYTTLDETDLTCAYDRLNVTAGPWVYAPAYSDPWYTRSTLVGLRAGVYCPQHYSGGGYLAYRSDYRDIVLGVDGLVDHWPWPRTQVGWSAEQRLATLEDGDDHAFRGSVFGRYIFQYSSSLYMPPMEYAEGYFTHQDNFLPEPRRSAPGARRYSSLTTGGLHYRVNYLTPYWDPAGGFSFDAVYAGGSVDLEGSHKPAHQVVLQGALVKCLPDLSGQAGALDPLLCWLGRTRLALHLYGAAAVPDEVEFFPLGGSSLFRPFDLEERQGSAVWVANVEWRVPLRTDLDWACCDRVFEAKNLYGALFYDVGEAYVGGDSTDGVAHGVGVGLRLDVAVFGFVERTTLRFDVAKALNVDTGPQFWFGVQHPF